MTVVGAGTMIGTFFVLGATAFADSVSLVNPLGTDSFPKLVDNVIGFLSTDVAIPLTVIMVLVGAFQMMTSTGDPEKFGRGRKTLLYAAIGFAVALLATDITSIISSILNNS